jgi:replicative DNA helicase
MSTHELNRPTSTHAEMTILGAMLVEPERVQDALDLLVAGDFSLDSHRQIFAAMERLAKLSQPIDIVTITEELMRKKELDSVGGLPYIASLSEGLPRKLSIESYVRIVRDKSRARALINLAERAAEEASDGQEEAQAVIERTIREIQELADSSEDIPLESVSAYIIREQPDPQAIFDVTAKSMGLLTPWGKINTLTCGFQPGELVIIAGRPSMGKSALALNLADYVTRESRKRLAFFSLEMSMQAMLNRLYCSNAGIDIQKLRTGELTEEDKAEILYARERLAEAPLFMSDVQGLTVSRIRSKSLRLHREEKVDGIIIDQLSGVSRADCKERDKHQKVGEQSRGLKMLGQEMGCPIIALNQLTRASTDRKDARPTLSDLKESGSLEEDADVVVFVHRPEYFDRNDEDLKGKAEIIIAKNRNGPVGTAFVNFNEPLCLWADEQKSFTEGYVPYRE